MKKTKTYLEFGKEEGKKKFVYDKREDQEAYDFFMIARYLKDMIGYRTGNVKKIHHKEDLEDNIKKYSALSVCKNFSRYLVYYEVGSTVMGVIDSLEYINKKFRKLKVKDITFIGVDNSDMMNRLTLYTHKSYKLKLYNKIKISKCSLFFAKGVSLLYAFDDEKLFCDVLKISDIAIFDYTFSLKGNLKDFVGTGKAVTYLSLDKCKEYLKYKNKELFLKPSNRIKNTDNNKATFECVYGEKLLIKKYFEELGANLKKFSLPVDDK